MSSHVRLALIGSGLALLALGTPAAALRNNYGVNIVNGTGITIQSFHFSACKDPNWGPDRLGATEIIAAGASRFFDMHDGVAACCRDMLAQLDNGAAKQRKSVNVCEIYEWEVR
jgi:hypothetical protein